MNNRFSFSAWLFLRALAVIHAIALVSFAVQWRGLIGPHGLLPAGEFLQAVAQQQGSAAWFELPTLCWWLGAGRAIPILCGTGLGLAGLLFAGIAPVLCLAGLWVIYLSLCGVGQVFYGYQWDALLLETTLMAIWLAPWSLRPVWRRFEPPALGRWLMVWLLFRLMLMSGAVKLLSGDVTWRDGTALLYHYETQPLPTPLAWYAHELPGWFHRISCLIMFAVELAGPFALLGPRAVRHAAALAMIALMALISLTGNYTYFNLLTAALCLLALDDAWWQRILQRVPPPPDSAVRTAPVWPLRCFAGLALVLTVLGSLPRLGAPALPWSFARTVQEVTYPLRSFNGYGLFAVMTHPRPELLIEGSDDGHDWKAYELPAKPGSLTRAPAWVAPYQPRLDWQLWFAALESPDQNTWVLNLCVHLLRGTPEVLDLFAVNPFPVRPPRFVRVVRHEYQFTDAELRTRTGAWWRRSPVDVYVGPLSLR
ncbi:MAG: lipase maturation factor family protein [Verrucomicrobia bacterium]|nr:lipase maturation factor family protein [Verrucomicrobiota bacterium]